MAVTTEQVQVEVEINGKKAGFTLKEIETTAKQLRRELRLLPTDSEEFAKKAAELQKVNTLMKDINNNVKAVDKSMQDAGKSGGLFSNALSGAFSVFTGGGLLDLAKNALGGIKDFITGSIEGSKEAAQAYAQLETALGGNAEAAQKLAQQSDDLEKSLAGLFSAEDVERAQTTLALYTQQTEQIEKLTPLITDFAAATGTDLATAAEMVGKSLEGDGDALNKFGISVAGAATEQRRFEIIAQGLTEKVGGQAKVVAETTKTGWDKLKVAFGDVMENVGDKLIPIFDTLGEFLVDLWNKSKPVVDVFKTIFGVFGQVWDAIKQLIASFGAFSNGASFAENIIKGLTLALTPLKLAWQGISFVIKGVATVLNELVAGASGTVNALTTIFNNFKTFFTNLFSNIGEVIKGVFTLDAAKIKEGIANMKNSFTSMGGEIAAAYSKGYNDVRDRQKAALDQKEEQEHQDKVKKTVTRTKQLTDAEIAALAEAERKKKEKADAQKEKDFQDELKRQADITNKLNDLNQQVETMKVAAMEDGMEKQIAQENLRYDREKELQAKRMNELRALGVGEAFIKQKNMEFEEQATQVHQNNLHDIELKGIEQHKADVKKAEEDLKKEREENYKAEIDSTNKFYDTLNVGIKEKLNEKIQAEHLTNEQIAVEKEKADLAILQNEIAKNEELLRLARENGQNTVQIENQIAEQKMDLAQRTATYKGEMERQVMDITKEGLDFVIQVLGQDEQARKKNAELIKAFSTSKVLVDLQEEIQAIWKTANANPTNILFPGSGNVIAGIKTALAVGRATLAVAKIQKQQFAAGGYTGDDGVDIFDAGEIAGVVHKNEWVAPKWMTTHPVYNSYITQLEGIRQRGFAQGGFTTTPVPVDLMSTENKLDEMINILKQFPVSLQAHVVYTEFETTANTVADVRNAAQVGK